MRAKSIFLALVSSSTSVIGLRVIFRRFLWSGKVDKGQLPSKITTCITSQSTFRDLGVLIDSQLTIEVHVRNVVHSCFYQLRQLRSIRRDHYQQVPGEPWLLHSSPVELVTATYVVLYGVSSQVIRRLQVVLNDAACLTPALRDVLHWLPVSQQIQFKIAISAFDCVREHCPA